MSDAPYPEASEQLIDRRAIAMAVVSFVLMLLMPRLAAYLTPAILAGFILITWDGRYSIPREPHVPLSLAIPLVALLTWVLVRSPFSAAGLQGFTNVLLLATYAMLVMLALGQGARKQPSHSQLESASFTMALLLTSILVLLHIFTDQWVARVLHDLIPSLRSASSRNLIVNNSVIALDDGNINRQTVMLALCLWPVWLMARNWENARSKLAGGVLAVVVISLVFYARSETAKLALAVSLTLLAAHAWRPWFAMALAVAGWTVAALLVVPLSIGLHDAGWHKSENLFYTARARVVIWNSVATKSLDRPIAGHALMAMRNHYYAPDARRALELETDAKLPEEAPHAHNIYLQIWYEFGGIGAALFWLTGAAMLMALWKQPAQRRMIGIAQFGLVAAILSTGYGLWQPWLQAGIAYSVFLLLRAGPDTAGMGRLTAAKR